jgi:AsmA family protein
LKIAGWAVVVLVVLIGLLGVAAYAFVTSDYVRAQVENHANALAGRKTTIGRVSVDWGWTSSVHLGDVQVSNADWGKADHMFKAQEISFDIRVWPLLHGDLVLPRLTLHKPEVALERNAQDQSNWSASESPAAHAAVKQIQPQQRREMPLIGRLEIVDGRVSYADAKRRLDLDGTIRTAKGQAGDEARAELALKGSIEGQPLTLHFIGGSALMLRDTDTPYPVDLDVAYGDTRLTIKGTLQDPLQYKGANVRLALSGSDLADIYPLLGIPGPPTPPYRIVGKLLYEPGVWHVTDMA